MRLMNPNAIPMSRRELLERSGLGFGSSGARGASGRTERAARADH